MMGTRVRVWDLLKLKFLTMDVDGFPDRFRILIDYPDLCRPNSRGVKHQNQKRLFLLLETFAERLNLKQQRIPILFRPNKKSLSTVRALSRGNRQNPSLLKKQFGA